MDLGGLIAEARVRADDAVEPFLTPDATFARWASEAEREACVRGRLLLETAAIARVTSIPVVAGIAEYPIDPAVHWIDAATFVPTTGKARELDMVGLDWIREQAGWNPRQCTRPDALADNGRNRLRIFPIPAAPGTLQLTVYRYPLYPMEDAGDEPEIRDEHHMGLVDWMMFRYWSQKDSEIYDPQRAAQAEADFEDRFGKRNSAGVMRRHRERRRVTTRYGGL